MIIVTLIRQGLTLGGVVRLLGLREHPRVAETERQARLRLATAARDHLDERMGRGELRPQAGSILRIQLEARIRRLEASDPDIPAEETEELMAEREARQDLLTFQRQTLLEMRARRDIGSNVLRSIERDLDLEEARLR